MGELNDRQTGTLGGRFFWSVLISFSEVLTLFFGGFAIVLTVFVIVKH